ncbi:E3 ubiquitin-protein ligase rnf168 isoform X2 [Engraulis encrasicolus]
MPPVSEVEIPVPEEGAGGLCRSDCVCPICLEIFIEPVTLPCDHTLCKPCFLETVDKASMCCPLCRKRVATWSRHHGRNNTLVNKELWQRIQKAFPEQCQRRLSGLEDDTSVAVVAAPKVCEPGELRREYEDEVTKVEAERRAREEEERRASEEFIRRMLEEDQRQLEEQRRRQQESQQKDEMLARQINQELNSDGVSVANPQPVETPPTKGIEKFFGPPRNRASASDSSFASSDMDVEMSILPSERPSSSSAGLDLPPLDYYGPTSTRHHHNTSGSIWPFQDNPSPPRSPSPSSSISSSFSLASASVCDLTDVQSPERRRRSGLSGKRKNAVLEDEEEEQENEPCGSGGSAAKRASCSSFSGVPVRLNVLQVLTQQEEVLQERQRQEQEDLQLALRLQRQLEKEERRRSAVLAIEPYQLRQKTPQAKSWRDRDGDGDGDNGSGNRGGRGEGGRRVNRGADDVFQSPTVPTTPTAKRTMSGERGGKGKAPVVVRGGGCRKGGGGEKGKTPKQNQHGAGGAAAAGGASSSMSPSDTTGTAAATATAPGLGKARKQTTITELFNGHNS